MSQNVLYDSARKSFATSQIDWEAGDIWCLLVNAGYSLDVQHTMLSAIDGAAGGPRDYSPSGDTIDFAGYVLETPGVDTNGAVYADARRFSTVPPALDPVNAIVLYKSVTTAADSPLNPWGASRLRCHASTQSLLGCWLV